MTSRVSEGVSAVAMAIGSVERDARERTHARAGEVDPTPITTGSESCSHLSMHELIPYGLFPPSPPLYFWTPTLHPRRSHHSHAKWRARVEMRGAARALDSRADDERAVERRARARCGGTTGWLAGVRGESLRACVGRLRAFTIGPPSAFRRRRPRPHGLARRQPFDSRRPSVCASRLEVRRLVAAPPPARRARSHDAISITQPARPCPRRRASAAATSHNSTAIIPRAPGRGAASRYARYSPRCSIPRRAPWRPFCWEQPARNAAL